MVSSRVEKHKSVHAELEKFRHLLVEESSQEIEICQILPTTAEKILRAQQIESRTIVIIDHLEELRQIQLHCWYL